MKRASWLSFPQKSQFAFIQIVKFFISLLSWLLKKLVQPISSKLTWWQKKELFEDSDDNAVSGRRHTPAIPAAKHHCCQPQRTKLNSSKATLLKSREEKFLICISRRVPRPPQYVTRTPQRPLASHLPPTSPHVNKSHLNFCNIWLFHFATTERKNCSSCSRRIPLQLLRPSRAHNGCCCIQQWRRALQRGIPVY